LSSPLDLTEATHIIGVVFRNVCVRSFATMSESRGIRVILAQGLRLIFPRDVSFEFRAVKIDSLVETCRPDKAS